VLALRQPAT